MLNREPSLTLKIMAILDELQAQHGSTRQEARYYALGYAEANAASHGMVTILREMITEDDGS